MKGKNTPLKSKQKREEGGHQRTERDHRETRKVIGEFEEILTEKNKNNEIFLSIILHKS